ncbi:hypothetical protein AV521_26625 [Streptomyces sp. IMTB 2501]|nr:hypothetical protein AV521_26625 [Streptomyces sp. IMTB 2501]
MIDVAHEPGPRLGGKPIGSLVGTGMAQLGPLDRVLLRCGRTLGHRHGRTPGRGAVAAPDLAPATETAGDQQDGEADEGVIAVPEEGTRHIAVAVAPGFGDEQLERQHPPAAEIAVPQQGPDQPADEEGDEGSADQLPGRDPLGLLLGPGPVSEAPHAGRRLRARCPQPGQEGGAVRSRREPRW